MLTKMGLGVDVVTAARQRIIEVFSNKNPIMMSFSGGKDSIVLADIVLNLIREGKIDPKRLTVNFIDEEAMYDEVIDGVKRWRIKFLQAGAKFNWYCMEYRHYNCLNSLDDEESFICWDRNKKDVWVRQKPDFAITDHPLFIPFKDNYQSFMDRLQKQTGSIDMIGVRAYESVQRLKVISKQKNGLQYRAYPIYDWTDHDVWLYLYKHHVDFPKVYENLYRVGTPKNKLRISQFFSIDTAKTLVTLGEIYPDIMERVTRREPNAYLCLMYWDTEMFGKSTKNRRKLEKDQKEEDYNYKKKFFDLPKTNMLNNQNKQTLYRKLLFFAMRYGGVMLNKNWKEFYSACVTGDPKGRKYRSITADVTRDYTKRISEENKK